MAKEVVRGIAAEIQFDGSRCIHSRHCVLDRPDVFVPNVAGEWIHPDAATPDEVMALARNCPSGAIVARRLDGGPGEAAPLVNTARVLENGPLAIHAQLTVRGEPAGFRATFCRCGQSKQKPYCDGSHAAAGFAATGEPAVRESAALPVRGGALAVEPQRNGPLKCSGPLEVISGTGHTIGRGTEFYFCRCGLSKQKPYCDGSHRAAGFTAE
ncbi:MAG: CDGSH iron-sulfur domain-containing protein [Proteobacteria bacterium]|nr:CDGSH iron-sulfur domain-containing protein [Pseudomonadota bacterium]